LLLIASPRLRRVSVYLSSFIVLHHAAILVNYTNKFREPFEAAICISDDSCPE
jgi:hypothetical protein